MSSVSDWDRKRTLDAMFSNVSPQFREQFVANVKKEQDKIDQETADKEKDEDPDQQQSFLVQAKDKPVTPKPETISDDDPFVVSREQVTGTAKPAGKSHGDDVEDDPKGKSQPSSYGESIDESLTGGLGMLTPKPMLVSVVPGTEVLDQIPANCTVTSSGTDNGHTHMAYYDGAGNGYTSEDEGHSHTVRSFRVSDYQSPDGGLGHTHSSTLERPEDTPGAVYQPFDGVVR